MPITFSIDEAASLITIMLSGAITDADIGTYLAASRADPRFRPSMDRLVVATNIASFPKLAEVVDITRRTSTLPRDESSRIAAVADSPLARGMVGMYFGLWGVGDRYELFDDVESAKAWLKR